MGLAQPLALVPRSYAETDLRDGMARLASGVALITCWDKDVPVGLAATSLVSLSVKPPRLLFSVRREASAHEALLKAGRCAAVILTEDEVDEAKLFAVSDVEGRRFKSPAWRLDDPFAPRFSGGLARFDLAIEHRIGAHEHTVFIVEVLDVASQAGAPLLFFERNFARAVI